MRHPSPCRLVAVVGVIAAFRLAGLDPAVAANPPQDQHPAPHSRSGHGGFPESSRRLCFGDYAFCSAATCTPTGKKIRVNTARGHAEFPAAECTCPILHGVDEVEVEGGNMQGSCNPPTSDTVWSGFWLHTTAPQELSNWQDAAAPGFVCGSDLKLGNQSVNGYSFLCQRAGTINGVEVATCTCPIGETFQGTAIAPKTAFFTQAGQCDPGVCSQYRVSDPIGFDDLNEGGQCIHLPDDGE